jgi:hypothetical protein
VLLGDGNGSFHSAVNYPAGSTPYALAAGDVNGDGIPDLAVANIGNTVSVLLGNVDGSFQAPISYPVGSRPEAVALADLTGDGLLDVVTANYTSGTVSVLLNDGNWPAVPRDAVPASRPLMLPEALHVTDTDIGPIAVHAPMLTTWPEASERLPGRPKNQPPGEPACALPVSTANAMDHFRGLRLSRLDSTHSATGAEDPLRNPDLE